MQPIRRPTWTRLWRPLSRRAWSGADTTCVASPTSVASSGQCGGRLEGSGWKLAGTASRRRWLICTPTCRTSRVPDWIASSGALLPAQPHLGGVAPRPVPGPGLRPVHPRRDRRGRLDHRSAARRPRPRQGEGRRHLGLGGAVRHRRRPALPRHHHPGARTSARAATRSRRSYIWEGGLGIWGAIALGALGAWIGARRHGVPFLDYIDAAAPGVAVAQALGRWGNWFNNELYGRATDVPWGLTIHEWDQSAGHAVRDAERQGRGARHLPADLPLRVAVVPAAGAGPGARRPPLRPAPGTAVRPLRRRLPARAGSSSS